MSPEKTVSKLRSTPAPSLAAAFDAKPEVGPAPNRGGFVQRAVPERPAGGAPLHG